MFELGNMNPHDTETLLEHGYRHFGTQFFRPRCKTCNACTPYRININGFAMKKWQRRILNKRLLVKFELPDIEQAYDLYLLHKRKFSNFHADSLDDFAASFFIPYEGHGCLAVYSNDVEKGRLLAVCHYDEMPASLSAIYTYYNYIDFPRFSLGSFAVLTLIQTAIAHGKEYVYLGYLLEDHPHMGYKSRYVPAEILSENAYWIAYAKNDNITQ